MAALTNFGFPGLPDSLIGLAIAEHESCTLPALRRLWMYYRNAPVGQAPQCGRYRLAQERGLPVRITGGAGDPDRASRDDRGWKPEAVVENDIAWRLQLMVDFMFGKPVQIVSTAGDPARREAIERVLDAVWEASGGIALLQDMALLGHVYGHIDLVLRAGMAGGVSAAGGVGTPRGAGEAGGAGMEGGRGLPALSPAPSGPGAGYGSGVGGMAGGTPAPRDAVRIELIEPTRGIPIVDPADYRRLVGYIIHFERELNAAEPAGGGVGGVAGRWFTQLWRGAATPRRQRCAFTEILTASRRRAYDGAALTVDEAAWWTGGEVPVVHIQNTAQPFRYGGLGEVEPLIPLQDELNTRLSDRAARVTLQSFKMYLAKGLEGFDSVPIGPGRIWTTENLEASVEAFGGDASSPSEESHIQEVREAMDKTSGVPPLASGVVRAKIGNLTSANALRITLMGVLSRTARKRVTYGRGIAQMSRLVLTALDALGVFATEPGERGVTLVWPDPLPEDVREQAAAAQIKSGLGVPRERILAELGYSTADAGVT